MVALRRPVYGSAHRRLRAKWAPIVAGGGVLCARCSMPIDPDELWHLGHRDGDPDEYNGPEHVRCNCRTQRRSREMRAEEAHPGALNA